MNKQNRSRFIPQVIPLPAVAAAAVIMIVMVGLIIYLSDATPPENFSPEPTVTR
ncbi:MAG: hypothetical protein LBH00_04655 [Planctomycetaceae bacterium]|jgi:hypothetical protein|nr:hypothetical protein [Planctomycetaceae bacterium]